MHTGTMLVRLALAVALSAAALAGCSDDDAAGDVDALAGTYAVQTDDGWEVQEAVDPAAGDPRTESERPPLDWYAEYVRSDYTEMVRLSSHEANISETRAELERLGFEFSDAVIPGGRDGVAGRSPGDQSSPEVLSAFMGSIEGATRDEWLDAGGVIR